MFGEHRARLWLSWDLCGKMEMLWSPHSSSRWEAWNQVLNIATPVTPPCSISQKASAAQLLYKILLGSRG